MNHIKSFLIKMLTVYLKVMLILFPVYAVVQVGKGNAFPLLLVLAVAGVIWYRRHSATRMLEQRRG